MRDPKIDVIDNPWKALPEHAPFVLPEDELFIDVYNECNRSRPERYVHTELLPEPFIGRTNAPLVLLALNPGYSTADANVQARPGFRDRVRRAIAGEATSEPFFHLDPLLPGPGHDWWCRVLGPLIGEFDQRRVAQSTLCLEYFPYHSVTFSHGALRLRSQEYTFELLRAALDRNGPIILMRGELQWFGAVPELARYSRLFRASSQRAARISQKNCQDGYLAACKAIAS